MYKNSKKGWSFALQAVYMALEFALLTTEHEAYAALDTTEFKEKFAKTHWSIADVRLFCFIFLRRIFGFTDKTDPVPFDNTVS